LRDIGSATSNVVAPPTLVEPAILLRKDLQVFGPADRVRLELVRTRTIGPTLAWLLKNTEELPPNGRDARVFRSDVFRDDQYCGSINFAVSGRILSQLGLRELERVELERRLMRSLKVHVGWLIQTRRFPRTDDSIFEIRIIDRSETARELLTAFDPNELGDLYQIPLLNIHFPPERLGPIERLKIANLFGFGQEQTLNLSQKLTVAVGENGSGKSSLRKILHELSTLALGEKTFGSETRWAHETASFKEQIASESSLGIDFTSLTYGVVLARTIGRGSRVERETLHDDGRSILSRPDQGGFDCVYEQRLGDNIDRFRSVESAEIAGPCDPDRTLLSELSSAWLYPAAASVQRFLAGIRTYSAWEFADAKTVARTDADFTQGFLFKDGSNLKSILGSLATKGDKTFDTWFDRVMRNEPKLIAQGSTLRYVHSGRDFGVTELSDGSLRWAQVLAAVLSEATMIVLDEPELGLHPDLIESLAAFLKEQALRVPILVFTHSKDLLSALDTMYRDDDETLHVQVLEQESEGNAINTPDLDLLRKDYPADQHRLGDLWARGLIGGNRW
jgi:predicted ATPase